MPYSKSTQKDYGDNPLQKRSSFQMRSGNATPFKMMGSSPVKQNGDGDSDSPPVISLEDYRASSDTAKAFMHQVSIDPTQNEPIHSGVDLALYNFMVDKYGEEEANKRFKTEKKYRVEPSKESSDALEGHEVSFDEYKRSHDRMNKSIVKR